MRRGPWAFHKHAPAQTARYVETDTITSLLGPEEDPWNVSRDDPKRQAIASLRGYAYQLHQSLAA